MTIFDLIKATIVCGAIAFLIYSYPILGQIVLIGFLSLLWLLYAHRRSRTCGADRRLGIRSQGLRARDQAARARGNLRSVRACSGMPPTIHYSLIPVPAIVLHGLEANLKAVQQRIEAACARAGREPGRSPWSR